jgi:hypothetical protein
MAPRPNLEVKLLWGRTVLDALSANDRDAITIGDGLISRTVGPPIRCDVEAPPGRLPSRRFTIAERSPRGSWAIVVHASMSGRVDRASKKTETLHEIVRHGSGVRAGPLAETWACDLDLGDVAYVDHGALTIRLSVVEQIADRSRSLVPEIQPAWANALTITSFVHLAVILAILATPRPEADSRFVNDEPIEVPRSAHVKREPHEWLAKLPGDPAIGPRRAEGASGLRPTKTVAPGTRKEISARSEAERARTILERLFGNEGRPKRELFGSGQLDDHLDTALGGLQSAPMARAGGPGLGSTKDAQGADRLARIVGPGELSRARREGLRTDGEEAPPAVKELIIDDPLYKDAVSSVIESHRPQIRYCYERELTLSPTLEGRITVEWVIGAEGVRSSRVIESSLSNVRVESCIASAIRRWPMPAADDEVTAVIRHPFVLRLAHK